MVRRILKNDLLQGIQERKILCAVIVFISITMTFLYVLHINKYFLKNENVLELTIVDVILYLFKGMKKYIPSEKNPFIIDWQYMLWNILLSILIGQYASKIGRDNDLLVLVKSKSKGKWYFSKIWWCLITILFYFFLIFLGIMIGMVLGGIFFSKIQIKFDITYNASLYQSIYASTHSAYSLVARFFVLNVLSYVCIYVPQMIITIFTNTFLGYVYIVSVLTISAFYANWYLIGNYQMLYRYEELYLLNQNFIWSIVLAILVSFIVCIAGRFLIEKTDLLKRK